jgi:NTE family protein
VAVAFSGGGFRASLAAVGVVRFLADAGLLSRVRLVSSVSGGSVAHGLLAIAWRALSKNGFAPSGFDELVIRPLIDRITSASLSLALVRNVWRTVGSKTRTDVLADFFDDWFFHGALLEDLPPGTRFVFNAANLSTGVRFGFERDAVGDYVIGLVPTQGSRLRVAQAVAASAAVPGAFAAMKVELPFPCAAGREAALLDGGTYDNLGLEVADSLPQMLLVALNAGGVFQTGAWGWVPLARDLKRAAGLLYRQTNALRMRTMVERFAAWEHARATGQPPPSWGRQGVLFGLATTMDRKAPPEWVGSRPEASRDEIVELALTKTSFAAFDRALCERLVHRGWWLAGATLTAFHRSSLPAQLPVWRPL